MVNKLIIIAHPSKKSFTHRICDTIKKSEIERNNSIKILDLYDTNLTQDFLKFENIREFPKTQNTIKLQKMISDADELIFVSPIWWADCPGILKNFFDTTFSSGFGFKYVGGKSVGLLKGKTAKVIHTCDGPGFFYKFPFVTLKTIWKLGRLGFCGIKLRNFLIIDKMNKRDDENRLKVLNKISNFK